MDRLAGFRLDFLEVRRETGRLAMQDGKRLPKDVLKPSILKKTEASTKLDRETEVWIGELRTKPNPTSADLALISYLSRGGRSIRR